MFQNSRQIQMSTRKQQQQQQHQQQQQRRRRRQRQRQRQRQQQQQQQQHHHHHHHHHQQQQQLRHFQRCYQPDLHQVIGVTVTTATTTNHSHSNRTSSAINTAHTPANGSHERQPAILIRSACFIIYTATVLTTATWGSPTRNSTSATNRQHLGFFLGRRVRPPHNGWNRAGNRKFASDGTSSLGWCSTSCLLWGTSCWIENLAKQAHFLGSSARWMEVDDDFTVSIL